MYPLNIRYSQTIYIIICIYRGIKILNHQNLTTNNITVIHSGSSVTSTINAVEIPFLGSQGDIDDKSKCIQCGCTRFESCRTNCTVCDHCPQFQMGDEDGCCHGCEHEISAHQEDATSCEHCGHSHIYKAPRSIILVDSAGVLDTRSNEINIANSLGMTKALQGAKSIKILLLIGAQTIGERGQNLGHILHIISEMFDGIDQKLDSIVYLFTKFVKDRRGEVINKPHMQGAVRAEKSLVAKTMLADMKERIDSGDGGLFLDPAKDKPVDVFDLIARCNCIENPNEVVRQVVCPALREKLNSQAEIDSKIIVNSLQRDDPISIELLKMKLNQWKTLNEISSLSKCQDTYKGAVSRIKLFKQEHVILVT